MCQKATISCCLICINDYTVKIASHSFAIKAVAHFLGLFLFLRLGFADGNIGVAALLLEAAAEVIVATVDSACAVFTFHIVVSVFRLDLVAANIAANCILDNHWLSSLESSSKAGLYCFKIRFDAISSFSSSVRS